MNNPGIMLDLSWVEMRCLIRANGHIEKLEALVLKTKCRDGFAGDVG